MLENEIAVLVQSGAGQREVARRLGCNRWVVAKVVKRQRLTPRRWHIGDKLRGRIEEMLSSGLLSQRQIAKACGVSQNTVGRCVQGMRDRQEPTKCYKPTRCPTCGSKLVVSPCVACSVARRGR